MPRQAPRLHAVVTVVLSLLGVSVRKTDYRIRTAVLDGLTQCAAAFTCLASMKDRPVIGEAVAFSVLHRDVALLWEVSVAEIPESPTSAGDEVPSSRIEHTESSIHIAREHVKSWRASHRTPLLRSDISNELVNVQGHVATLKAVRPRNIVVLCSVV